MSTDKIEYNTDLALYESKKYSKGQCMAEECMPEQLELGETYEFVKKGHRNYELSAEVTLLEMKEDEVLFDMRARGPIIELSFFIEEGQSYTRGKFTVNELLS